MLNLWTRKLLSSLEYGIILKTYYFQIPKTPFSLKMIEAIKLKLING